MKLLNRLMSLSAPWALCTVLNVIFVGTFAYAGPGAHGPNGEHLDAPTAALFAPQSPRVVAQSEAFELVAELQGGRLSIILDRYESNEPVLAATLEVAAGDLKATATFQSDSSDYAVTDAPLLALLSQPGEHALVFTILAGAETDLLDGVLVTGGEHAARPNDHHDLPWWKGLGIGTVVLAALLALAYAVWRRRRTRGHTAERPLEPSTAAGSSRHSSAPRMLGMLALLTPVSLSLVLLGSWSSNATAGPGAHGPNGEHLDAPSGPVLGSALARLPDGSVNVPKLAQRRMAIRTLLAPESEAAATTELPGRVIIDPNAGGRIQPVHGGRLEAGPRGLPVVGQRVTKGDVLAYVRHHAEPFAVGAQQAQLAELQAQRKLAQQRVIRLEMLEGTVPRKDLEAAHQEAASLLEREGRIGQSLSAREALVSPIDGVIARSDAALGQVLEARDVVFEVVDPARLMVEASTADPALAGAVATATLQGIEGVHLRLVGAARVLRDGVLPLIFLAKPGPDVTTLPLAVGQPVLVLAQTRQRIKGIVLPATAVVRNPSNEPIVWIKSGPERFIPQPVQFRYLDSRTVVVTQGLSADNRVVVQGAPLIAQIR